MKQKGSMYLAWGLTALLLVFVLSALGGMTFSRAAQALLCAVLLAGLALAGNRRLERLPDWGLALTAAAIGVTLRLVWLVVVRVQPVSDFARFMETAELLLKGDLGSSGRYIAMFPHTLGYPFFLAPLFALFGPAVWVGQAANLLLAALILWLLFAIGRRMGGRLCGFWAALLWACQPSQIFAVSLLGTELLFTAGLLGCIFLYLVTVQGQRNFRKTILLWAALGVLMAVCSAVRPMWPVLLLAFAIHGVLWPALPGGSWRRLGRTALGLGVALLAVLSVNSAVYTGIERLAGEPVARGGAGWNLYLGMNADTAGRYNKADEAVFVEAAYGADSAPEAQNELTQLALERVRKNLADGRMTPLLREKFQLLWSRDTAILDWIRSSFDESSSAIQNGVWLERFAALSDVYYATLLFLFAAGLWIAVQKRLYALLPCGILLAGWILMTLLMENNGRYTFPAAVLLALPAAVSLGHVRRPR